MPYNIYLPNGDRVENIPDEVSRDEAMLRLRNAYPHAFPAPHEETVGGAFLKGFRKAGADLQTAYGMATEDSRQAAIEALERNREIEEKYGTSPEFSDVSGKWNKGDYLGALGEAGKQFVKASGENLPAMAGIGTVGYFGGLPAAAAAAYAMRVPSGFAAQAESQLAEGKPLEDVSKAKSFEYAAPMAALDVVSELVPMGRGVVSKVFGPEVAKLLERGATAEAEVAARSRLAAGAIGMGKNLAVQGVIQPTEVALQRAENGQDLLSKDALESYGASLYQAGLLSPLGIYGGLSERSAAKARLAKKAKLAKETMAFRVDPDTGEVVPPNEEAQAASQEAVEPVKPPPVETKPEQGDLFEEPAKPVEAAPEPAAPQEAVEPVKPPPVETKWAFWPEQGDLFEEPATPEQPATPEPAAETPVEQPKPVLDDGLKQRIKSKFSDLVRSINMLKREGWIDSDKSNDYLAQLANIRLDATSLKDFLPFERQIAKDFGTAKKVSDETVKVRPSRDEGEPRALTGRDLSYSESDVTDGVTGSSTVEDVENKIRSEFGIHGDRLLDSGKVTVVPDVDSLPPREDGLDHPEGARGAVIGDNAYIVAGNIGVDEVKSVMLHEVGAHIGLERMIPADQYQRILNDAEKRIQNGEEPFVKARARADAVVDANDPDREDTVRRETLAYLIENRPDLPFVKRILSQIKVALNNWSGGRLFNLNADDLRTAAIGALRRVSSAEEAARPDSFYRKNNPTISYSKAAKQTVTRIEDAVRVNLPDPTDSILGKARSIFFGASNLPTMLRNGINSFLSIHDFARFYGDKVPELKTLDAFQNNFQYELNEGREKINKNIKNWMSLLRDEKTGKMKFDKATMKRFMSIALDTTINQVEVLDTPERIVDGVKINSRKVAPKNPQEAKIVQDFNKLPEELKRIYRELRDEYDSKSAKYLDAASKMGASEQAIKAFRESYEKNRLQVYLPLFRRGNYWLSFEDADGQSYRMAFRSYLEREQAMKDAKAQGAVNVTKFKRLEELIQRDKERPPMGILGDMMKLVGDKADPGLRNAIYETYLDYLPASSLKQRFRSRSNLNILGMESDIIQAYAHVGGAMENALAKIKNSPKQDEIMKSIKARVESSPPEEKEKLQEMYASLNEQVNFFNNPHYNNLISKAGWYSYIWDLAGNASTAVVALLHSPILVSRLAAEHGYGKAFSALLDATTKFKIRMGEDDRTTLPENYSALAERALKEGALGYHIGREMFDIRETPIVDYTGMKSKVTNGMNYMLQLADRFNREAVLKAAYELELAKNETTHETATEEQKRAAEEVAINHVKDGYGSAFSQTGPAINHKFMGAGRLAFTFKRFAFARLANLAKMFNTVFSDPTKDLDATLQGMKDAGKTPAEIKAYEDHISTLKDNYQATRKMAMKTLLGYYATAFAMSGVSGMPLVGGLKYLAQLLSDEFADAPHDIDAELHDLMGEFMYKGPINALMGIEMADRTGWNDMFWKEEPSHMAESSAFGWLGERAFGPIYSLASKSYHGLQLFKDGQFERGLEMVMPTAIANVAKALRYASEGAKTESGRVLSDDVNGYNVLMQAIGFAPTKVNEPRARQEAMSEMQKKLDSQRNSLLTKMYSAEERGDADDMTNVYERIYKYNETFPDNPITESDIDRHRNTMHSREQNAVDGFQAKKKWAGYLREEYGVRD